MIGLLHRPGTLSIINRHLPEDDPRLTEQDIRKYYKDDRIIWSVFLAFRRLDRWLRTRLLGKRYEFLLPGRIQR